MSIDVCSLGIVVEVTACALADVDGLVNGSYKE